MKYLFDPTQFYLQLTQYNLQILKRILLLSVCLFCWCGLRAQTLPDISTPPRLVNDFAGLMSSDQENTLEKKLVAFDDSTSNQIAIITVKSLEGYDISDYTIKTFNKWKIGTAKNNNGILILISAAEHKVWITTGRGLEAVVTDALSRRIIDNIMVPSFKQNQYYDGLDAGTTALMQLSSPEFHNKRVLPNAQRGNFTWVFFLIIVIFIIIAITRGNGGGPNHISRGGNSNWPLWMLMGGMLGGGWGGGSGGGGWGGGGDGGGGSGGGGWGGGGDGGGFGGFGGGDSGGGGAGGSW